MVENADEPVFKMLATLEGSPLLDKIEAEWEILAKALNVSSECIESIRTDVLFYSANPEKVLSIILLNWRLRCGPTANFTTLIKVVEERCKWINIGAQMKRNKELCNIEIDQNTKWGDLPVCKQHELCTKEVCIFGVKRPFLTFTRGIREIVLRSILNDTLNNEELCNFINTPGYEIFRVTTPDALPYYVEREVFLKNKININNFLDSGTDIFAVEGIDEQTLGMVAGSSHDVDLSSNQMQNISCRFILLEQPAHFEQLCLMTSSTIHYIRFHMGNYIRVKTSGQAKNILKFKENPVCINEDSFIKIHLTKHSPCIICISGNSGDGKTTFLANIARKLQKYYKDRIVIFISFLHILANLNNDHEEFNVVELVWIIANHISANELGRKLISDVLINPNYQIELFLDGYDELLSSERHAAKNVLACLAKGLKHSRIFVTANENQYREVEHQFSSVTWAIGDFQKNDQIKLLNSYWSHFKEIEITNDLSIFSEKCVSLLACSKVLNSVQFVGSPMLTVILAYQYEDFVRDFLRGNLKTVDNGKNYVTNIALFKAFFKGIFAKINTGIKGDLIQLALEKSFPKNLTDVLFKKSSFNSETTSKLLSSQLLQKSSFPHHIEFVHNSFADFISIQFLCDQIRDNDVEVGVSSCPQLLSFLMQTVTDLENRIVFVNLPLCLVFNALLLDQSELKRVNARLVFEHLSSQVKNLSKIFLACLNSELYGILCLLIRGVPKHAQKIITESPSLSSIGHDKLLNFLDVASRHVDIKMARKFHKSLEISKADISSIVVNKWKILSIPMTSLHFAAKQGNMKLFDYFLDYINLSNEEQLPKFLCHALVYNSKYDLPHIVESKLEILTKLVKITYGQILQEKSDKIPLVHLLKNIHIRLIKCLIESDVDLFAVDSQQNTLAHQIVDYMAADEYHELVEILLSRNAGSLFRKANRNNETAFSTALRTTKLEDKTVILLLTSKEMFTEGEIGPKDTYVYQIIKAGYGSEVIATAFEFSSRWNHGYFNGGRTTLLHVSVLYQNIEAVEFFLNAVGISANARDESGLTPYHVACSGESLNYCSNYNKSVKIIKLLVNHDADVRLTDNSGKLPLSYLLGNNNKPTNDVMT